MDRELLKTMPEPPKNNEVEVECCGVRVAYFGECNGHLHLILFDGYYSC